MNNKIIFLSLLMALIAACKPTGPEPDKPNDSSTGKNLTIQLKPLVNGLPLSWAAAFVSAAGDTIQFDRIKFLLSNFTLEKSTGEFVVLPNAYAYLTLKDGRDSVILKNVPNGSYKSFRFSVGLDSNINHSDPAQWPLDHALCPSLNEMHWGWSGGYIFNVIEGYYRNKGSNAGFSFHIALEKNVRNHAFVQNFDITKNTKITFNLFTDKYFSNVVNFSLKNDGSFSHSGNVDPVMDKFIQNVNGLFELKSIE